MPLIPKLFAGTAKQRTPAYSGSRTRINNSFITRPFRECVLTLYLGIAIMVPTKNLQASEGSIMGIISVDWEGRTLDQDDLDAMQAFRKAYPHIGLLQFFNAAYYTKWDANPSQVTEAIRSVTTEKDEHGLHIHAWRSLVEHSGVVFRRSPNWSYPGEISMNSCHLLDCGHNVPISAYNESELRLIIQSSQAILKHQGFNKARSFRAGGWMASSQVIQALAKEGFVFDSSATDAELLKDRRYSNRLYHWLAELWQPITTTSQPYLIGQTPYQLFELPDNGILADYISAEEMLEIFKQNVSLWRNQPNQDVYFSIGFHQESAARYLHRIRDTIDLVEAYAEQHQLPFRWAKLPLNPNTLVF